MSLFYHYWQVGIIAYRISTYATINILSSQPNNHIKNRKQTEYSYYGRLMHRIDLNEHQYIKRIIINSLNLCRMSGKSDYTFKVVIIGNSGVGKTQLALKLCNIDRDSESSAATIAVDNFRLYLANKEGRKLLLNIWDTAGQEKYRTINKMYFSKADAIIFVYSIVEPNTMQVMKEWISEALDQNQSKTMCVAIVGNKIDLQKDYQMSNIQIQQIEQLSQDYSVCRVKKFTVSARTGQNVQNMLSWITETLSEIVKDRNPIGDRPIAISLAASSFINVNKDMYNQKHKCCS